MDLRLDVVHCRSTVEVRERLAETLAGYRDLFPLRKDAKILLKPNLNSNNNALTGNTTDLRLLSAVIHFLQREGYANITIAEGTNSGFYRNKIGVISRLKVDALAGRFGVETCDLNDVEGVEIPFEDGITASVARDFVEANFIINLPKLKTHFEMGMSVCLKNLIGCMVGQENKKKVHKSLARNILHINKAIRPQLHIVDGLFAMEGLGPTRGTPVNLGCLLVGADPYLVDLVCARIAGFGLSEVLTLRRAKEEGLVTADHETAAAAVALGDLPRRFLRPQANPFAAFIHSPKRQRYFLAVRNTAFFNYLCSTSVFGNLLFLTGLRQDKFIPDEMAIESIEFAESDCKPGCARCATYCPVDLELPKALSNGHDACIECMYCFMVCPTGAISIRGDLGFFAEPVRQYHATIKRIA